MHTTYNTTQIKRYMRLFVILLFLIVIGDYWLRGELGKIGEVLRRTKDQLGTGGLIAGGTLYMVFLSIPFVPGVELGLLLMCLFGREGIVLVYGCTVGGLLLSFAMGQCFPKS